MLERFVATVLLERAYLNDCSDGVLQILASKNILAKPLIFLEEKSVAVVMTKGIQRKGHFVVLAPCEYRREFKFEYNVANATNFSDVSWPEVEDRCQ